MNLDKSWKFAGAPSSAMNRLYDWLRMRLNNRLVRFLRKNALGGSNNVVLECGSGSASGASLLARRGEVKKSVALDLDLEALRECRRRDPNLPVVLGDIHALPFAEDTFDLVWNNSTIEHLPYPALAVMEMARVCKPAGKVFIGVPYRFGPLGFQPIIKSTRAGIWIGPVFSRQELFKMMQQAGLYPRKVLRFFFRFFIGAVANRPEAMT